MRFRLPVLDWQRAACRAGESDRWGCLGMAGAWEGVARGSSGVPDVFSLDRGAGHTVPTLSG